MKLKTVDEIVDALGGTVAVARLVNLSKQAVCNWRYRKGIPARNYATIEAALAARRLVADKTVYSFK